MLMSMFVRLTVAVAIGLLALVVLAFVLKVVFVAAIVAALVVGCMVLARRLRGDRRDRYAPVTISVPRRPS
jgi:hypothetical protein